MKIKYIDLFAGIGGFHAVGTALGWECVFASEIDVNAARIYELNWGINPLNDISQSANDVAMDVPEHDVLFAGFPCQPFSKSGKQLGMDETRGTLFWNILKVIVHHRPSLVVLENVRNLAGPKHKHEWMVIIEQLRQLGYRVSDKPFIVSPHRLQREAGGRPQNRERIYIVATKADVGDFWSLRADPLYFIEKTILPNPNQWNLNRDLPLQKTKRKDLLLSQEEIEILSVWNDLIQRLLENENGVLPGFPFWTDFWNLKQIKSIDSEYPLWKIDFIEKNQSFYRRNASTIDSWLKRNPNFKKFPNSRRKFEWQAQDAESIWSTLIQLRPSGIRVKKPTYVPALVAITQTSILGNQRRRLSIREVTRLQGLPEWFSFGNQSDAQSYKQLGNGISVGAAYQVMRSIPQRDADLLSSIAPKILNDLEKAPLNPDLLLEK